MRRYEELAHHLLHLPGVQYHDDKVVDNIMMTISFGDKDGDNIMMTISYGDNMC